MQQELAVDSKWAIVTISNILDEISAGAKKECFANGNWKCPVCGWKLSIKFWNKWKIEWWKVSHFFHLEDWDLFAHEPETEAHRKTKHRITEELRQDLEKRRDEGELFSFDGPRCEEILCDGKSRADVYFETTDTSWLVRQYAIEVQYSAISTESLLKRHNEYLRHGIVDFWIFWEKGFLSKTSTGKFRPAAVLENIISIYWFVCSIDEGFGIHSFFPMPADDRVCFEEWDSEFLYFWTPKAHIEYSFSRASEIIRIDESNDKGIEKHLEKIELGVISDWQSCFYVSPKSSSVIYDPKFGVHSAYSSFVHKSKEMMEVRMIEINEEKEERILAERENAINIERARRQLDSNGQIYLIIGFGLLSNLLENVFHSFYKKRWSSKEYFMSSLERFQKPFYGKSELENQQRPSISSALKAIFKRLVYIRSQPSNKYLWECYRFDKYIRWYALCLWEYSKASGTFSNGKGSVREITAQARLLFEERLHEEKSYPIDFEVIIELFCEYYDERYELDAILKGRGLPKIMHKLTGRRWEELILILAAMGDGKKEKIEKHLQELGQLFGQKREYSPETFLKS